MVAEPERTLRFTVAAADAQARPRLDQFLSSQQAELTRSQLQRLIESGDISVNGAVAKPSRRLREGDVVEVTIPPVVPATARPEAIPLVVLYEDEHVIVVDKPAGMVVHPAPGHSSGTLVNALLAHCDDLSGIGGELRPGIVHRIDKDTSGVILATKSDAAHQVMAAQFQNKEPAREYVAIVAPPPTADAGTFETLYGRHPRHRKKFSSRVVRGKRAVTHYRVQRRFSLGAALVTCQLETGRTHQIRVHFSDAGMPLLGDPVYSRRRAGQLGELAAQLGRQALHARLLGFRHPITGEVIEVESELPDDIKRLIEELATPDR